MSIETMRQVLAVLEEIADEVFSPYDNKLGDAILALRAAIEEAEPVYAANEAFGKRQEGWNDRMFEMEAELQRYKTSAAMWRNKAYEASGHPLPWKPDELWQGLTEEEILKAVGWETAEMYMKLTPNFPVEEARKETVKNARAIEAKLKEKNSV